MALTKFAGFFSGDVSTETNARRQEMNSGGAALTRSASIPIETKSSERITEELSTSTRHYVVGWLMWLTLMLAVTFSVLMLEERSVTRSYRSAVFNWFEGKPLYSLQGHGFLYLPQAALTFAPWAVLPHETGEVVWRLCLIAVMAASAFRLTRLLNGDGGWFLAISACSTVMAWGCARNGQSTLLITGMMIFAVADLSEKNWWRAAITLALAFAVKPLAIVLILLAVVIYPAVSWRLALSLLAVAILPFATQQPDYVVSQYVDCVENLRVTFRVGETENWAQFFGMLNVAGIPVPPPARNLIRILASGATLVLCAVAVRKLSPKKAAYYLFSLAACYVMLFNSRTEGNTYAMVGPVYGALLAEAIFMFQNKVWIWRMASAVVLSVANFDLAVLVCSRENAIWISPLVCLFVSGHLIKRLLSEIRNSSLQKSLQL